MGKFAQVFFGVSVVKRWEFACNGAVYIYKNKIRGDEEESRKFSYL